MKLFDLHADIGYDVYHRHKAGNDLALIQDHLPKLLKGEFRAVAMASFFEGQEPLEEALAMVQTLHQQLKLNAHTFHHVMNGDFVEDKINVIMSLEGLGFLKEGRLDVVDAMVDLGIRLASMTWNDQNASATGISGSVVRGLSSFGQAVLERFNQRHVVVDVSHLNEKSFWDVLTYSSRPVIASHSNTKHHCFVERNLTDQQIRALIEQGGLIGLNAARKFIDLDEIDQTAHRLAEHAVHMLNLGGENHVALGFDYMDFIDFGDTKSKMAHDLPDASHSQTLIKAFYDVGLKTPQIEKIAYLNAFNFFKTNL